MQKREERSCVRTQWTLHFSRSFPPLIPQKDVSYFEFYVGLIHTHTHKRYALPLGKVDVKTTQCYNVSLALMLASVTMYRWLMWISVSIIGSDVAWRYNVSLL